MTWYTGTCGIMAMGLLYKLALWLVCVCRGFGSNSFMTNDAAIPMDGHYRTNIISDVGHPWSDSVMLLMLCTVQFAMAGALALYYRSFGTASTLLRKDNISSRPYY